MAHESKKKTEGDLALDALVRRAIRRGESPTSCPSDDSVLAYLSGTATDQEREKIREALLRSSEFRDDFLEIAEDFDRLSEVEEPEGDGGRRTRADVERSAHRRWSISWLSTRPAFAYGLAAICLALWLVNTPPTKVGGGDFLTLALIPEGESTRGPATTWIPAEGRAYLFLRMVIPVEPAADAAFHATVYRDAIAMFDPQVLPIVDDHVDLVLPTHLLRPGSYEIRVEQRDAIQQVLWKASAAFDVRAGE